MTLTEYKRKRRFGRTPEPSGKRRKSAGKSQFVVQKHAASRLHYDFRLEMEGVLKSWAVPKGPSLDPSRKQLAVAVEDHPLEYAAFEGVIPKGEYGGGAVMVWDRGTFVLEGNPQDAYRRGKLTFELFGEKLHGRWSLVRMAGRRSEDGKNWLLIKGKDQHAIRSRQADVVDDQPLSVLTGRDLSQIAEAADAVWQSAPANVKRRSGPRQNRSRAKPKPKAKRPAGANPSRLPGAKRASQPVRWSPQLATLTTAVPEGDDWLHEMKFDGYRLVVLIERQQVRLFTRNGNDWTSDLPQLAGAIRELGIGPAILDGELVAMRPDGTTDFQALQNSIKGRRTAALVYYVFDVPHYGGYDLTQVPLASRKEFLAELLAGEASDAGTVRYSDHIRGGGEAVLRQACQYAVEGVVSKRADSAYEPRRTKSWLKIKCDRRQEFVIGGYTPPGGSRQGFGSLLLGYYDGQGRLVYCGRVGTGFSDESLRRILTELRRRESGACPFTPMPARRQTSVAHWVHPELVAEVRFAEWTEEGLLRHPAFEGLRVDKPPREVVREDHAPSPKVGSSSERQEARPGKHRASIKVGSRPQRGRSGAAASTVEIAGIAVSHPEREVFPDAGITKQELVQFYADIADWILPHVAGRPLTVIRCPQGQAQKCFFQKHRTESMPASVGGIRIREGEKDAVYLVVEDLPGLVSLVQFGVIEFHPWGATVPDVEKPDRLVFDLDPDAKVPWKQVLDAARRLRDVFGELRLESYVRTSGGKGLHVVLPLSPEMDWTEAKDFARSVATGLVEQHPELYVATASKAKRNGKIFIDWLRNSRGATSVASYSVRARPGAPVAAPLRWEELSRVTPDRYNLRNLRRRLSSVSEDPWAGLTTTRQTLPRT